MVRRIVIVLLISSAFSAAQTFPTPKYFQQFFVKHAAPQQAPAPEPLAAYIVDGKLRLSLADAIRLTLANNTDVRINQLQVDTATYGLQRTYAPFDPVLISNFAPRRDVSPTTSTLQGAQTLSSLSQNFSSTYSQLFQTGTLYQVGLSATRSATNSVFATFNPSIFSSLNISISQPLLRNRGLFPNRAPIVIAQRNLKQSRSNFEAQVNNAVARAINQYWDVVQARESLGVLRQSLELAEATYKQNKRALELGALPPLDIYRSESQVAQRKLQVIQAEYQLKQLEDEFRRTIGADLDDRTSVLDLDLTENAEPGSDLRAVDVPAAIQQALKMRPELEAVQQQLANDDTSIRLAHNSMQPDLSLTTFYSMNGRGGNQVDTSTGAPILISQGGFGDALEQLSSRDFPTYGFSLQFRLPLRNRGAEGELGQALVSKRRTLYQLRQRQQEITLDVKNAAHQLEQAKLSIAAARVARDLAKKNLEAEQRKYELGTQTIFFVLDAQTQLSQAEQALVQAQIGYQRAIVAVDRATGELLGQYKVQLN